MAVAETRNAPLSREEAAQGAIAENFRLARRHSLTVRMLKFLLPAAAVLIALGFVVYSYLLTPSQISVDLAGTGFSDGKLIMANPKLDGFTRENRPYRMRAVRAVQDMKNTGVIELDKINARLPLSGSNWADVEADKGIYDKDKNTLDITSDMTVTTTDGMVAKFKSAFIAIGNGNMRTADPVDIKLQRSHVTADSLDVQQRGKVLVFDRNVRVVMQPQSLKSADAASGETNAKE
jgi:lipopolysaccharide export system protein LptC